MTDLLMTAYDYLDYLRNNEKYQAYIKLNKEVKSEFKEEFANLAKAKKAFEEVLEYGKNHPDFKTAANHYSSLSKTLYSKPKLIEQVKLNQDLENNINEFLKSLTNLISDNIPILNELGIVSKKGGISCGC